MTSVLLLLWVLGCGSSTGGSQWETPPGAPPWPEDVATSVRTAVEASEEQGAWANRLMLESSPYLRQHARNPVDWQPWSDAAFEQAAREDKPVLLSIGYSTCHWCHVMERESFEDPEIAQRINEHFVAIKVDRETRPDVDAVYLRAAQSLLGNAGWPLTLVLTPEREVFFAGTYLPARTGDRAGKTGLYEVLGQLSGRWEKDRDNLMTHAEEVSRRVKAMAKPPVPTAVPPLAVLDNARDRINATFDTRHGGFGRPPRFPNPTELQFLLSEFRRTGDAGTLEIAERTLEAILEGGLRDHLGGGFHRYCVDADWTVPHFEKMTTDQAQLALLLLDAWQLTGKPVYRDAARDTLDYALRELRDPAGGFWTAVDADSTAADGELVEGAFYTWTPDEIRAATGDDADLALAWFGVTDAGDLDGRSVLTARGDRSRIARDHELTAEELDAALVRIRRALYQARKTRPAPHTDDKVVLGYNALMVSALARAHFVLGEEAYGHAARKAARFSTREMAGKQGALHRSWRAGKAEHDAVLEDYALQARAMLDLFEATGESDWLYLAETTAQSMEGRFADEAGGWFETPHEAEGLITRGKPWSDGALPGPNAVAIEVCLRLHQLTGTDHWLERADRALAVFGEPITLRGAAGPTALGTVAFRQGTPRQLAYVPGQGSDTLLPALRSAYRPTSVLVLVPGDADGGSLVSSVPWLRGKGPVDGKATVYVCQDGLCEAPTTDPERLQAQLEALGTTPTPPSP